MLQRVFTVTSQRVENWPTVMVLVTARTDENQMDERLDVAVGPDLASILPIGTKIRITAQYEPAHE